MPVTDDRAPDTAAQTDLLMGENAYFINVGQRSPHFLIEDTCTNCHEDNRHKLKENEEIPI